MSSRGVAVVFEPAALSMYTLHGNWTRWCTSHLQKAQSFTTYDDGFEPIVQNLLPCYGFWGRIRLRRRASVDRHDDDHARVRRYPNLVGGARIQGQREGRLVLQGHAEQALVEVGVQHGLAGARPEAAILPRRLCEGTKVGQQLVRVDRIALRVVVTKPFYETGVDHVAKHAYELGVER
eukprot:scaffold3920_cov262-Pinguiococcus_pyrenoidosus.AAC.12